MKLPNCTALVLALRKNENNEITLANFCIANFTVKSIEYKCVTRASWGTLKDVIADYDIPLVICNGPAAVARKLFRDNGVVLPTRTVVTNFFNFIHLKELSGYSVAKFLLLENIAWAYSRTNKSFNDAVAMTTSLYYYSEHFKAPQDIIRNVLYNVLARFLNTHYSADKNWCTWCNEIIPRLIGMLKCTPSLSEAYNVFTSIDTSNRVDIYFAALYLVKHYYNNDLTHLYVPCNQYTEAATDAQVARLSKILKDPLFSSRDKICKVVRNVDCKDMYVDIYTALNDLSADDVMAFYQSVLRHHITQTSELLRFTVEKYSDINAVFIDNLERFKKFHAKRILLTR